MEYAFDMEGRAVNDALLYEELNAILPGLGTASGRGIVRVIAPGELSKREIELLAEVMDAHDGTKLSSRQAADKRLVEKMEILKSPMPEDASLEEVRERLNILEEFVLRRLS